MRPALVVVAAFAIGCGGNKPSGGGGGSGGTPDSTRDMASTTSIADLAGASPSTDMSLPVAQPQDLGSSDLAGFVNCFGAAVCDPATSFCMRYHSGSQASPGNLVAGPACFEPADCMGTTMNCTCIMQDANLGGACPVCVDHMDGTYDCYTS
jgi:hypothetical protein